MMHCNKKVTVPKNRVSRPAGHQATRVEGKYYRYLVIFRHRLLVSFAFSRRRVDCCDAKACGASPVSRATYGRSPSPTARREKDGSDDDERATGQPRRAR